MPKNNIEICLTPLQYKLYERPGNIVVLIDVIRATTVFATALFNGANEIIPVVEIEETLKYKNKGFLTAGERNSNKLEGFDFGNSPIEFTDNIVKNRSIAITTTNGTQALNLIPKYNTIVAGSWVNQQSLLTFLKQCNTDVLLLCSGWKFATCIEDTLFAGQIAMELIDSKSFDYQSDSVSIATLMAREAMNKELDFILNHSPRLRAKYPGIKNEIDFCLSKNSAPVIPILERGAFIL